MRVDIHLLRLQILQLVQRLVHGRQHLYIHVDELTSKLDTARHEHSPTSKLCFAMPLDASLPAKLPYIPSALLHKHSMPVDRGKPTWSIEIPPRGDVKYDPINRQQNSSILLVAVEWFQ